MVPQGKTGRPSANVITKQFTPFDLRKTYDAQNILTFNKWSPCGKNDFKNIVGEGEMLVARSNSLSFSNEFNSRPDSKILDL